MDLSVSLCIAAAFAILCTFYIGKSILVMDFSEYLPKNLKKAKLKRLLNSFSDQVMLHKSSNTPCNKKIQQL